MKRYEKHQIDFFIKEYKSGKNTKWLQNNYGISDSTMSYYLGKYNIRKPLGERNKRYSCNQLFFETIDTKEKAYILGFIYADGCNNEDIGRLDVSISVDDIEILNLIKKNIEYTGPIRECKYLTVNGKSRIRVDLCINSDKLSRDIKNKGCMAKKSLILDFPDENQVPEILVWHFIRGYFDGDGSLMLKSPQASLCVSNKFGKKMIKLLDRYNIHSYLRKTDYIKNKIDKLEIGKIKDCMNFLELLYENSNGLRLERKHNIYQKHLTKYKNNGKII